MEEDVDIRERIFHNAVREYIISGLLFILLYVTSYIIICTFKTRTEKEDVFSADSEDALVYRTSIWLCTFTLAVSGGAVLLLPISIAANESVLLFPNSPYLEWVNSSLIKSLWNQIFLCSNLSIFILMPFAYLFTESEGLPGSRKGIMSRVYETTIVLILISIVVCGLTFLATAIIDQDRQGRKALFDIWNFYLPYLYSCMSLLGVIMLLICTPVGFARMFTVVGELVIKPRFLRDLEEELNTVQFEEETLKRRLVHMSSHDNHISNGNHHNNSYYSNGHNSYLNNGSSDLRDKLEEVQKDRAEIEKRRQASSLRRNVGYPLMMLLLLLLTTTSVLMVTQNTLELLIGLKALPRATQEIVLGMSSLSALGPIGAVIEVAIIFYLMLASLVGIYSIPYCECLRPKREDTPVTKVIANCVIILVLSSALPVLSRTLGITNFDLLGNYGSIEWLGNFYIILSYNLAFAVATALCLFTKFTSTLRRELLDRLEQAFIRGRRSLSSTDILHTKDE